MTETPTPWSDAAITTWTQSRDGIDYDCDYVPVEVSRKLERELAEARRAISDSRAWIPVEERMPEEEEYVLVRVAATPIDNPIPWIGEGRYAEDEFDDVMRWSVATPLGWASPVNVTHWMPLPESPK